MPEPPSPPIKLEAFDYRLIAAAVVVAAVSLAIGAKYFWRAFPEAAIEFRVTRADSEPIARSFLTARGFALAGRRHAARFDFDEDAKVYLERTQGLERMNTLTRGPIHLWRWQHRWFKPGQEEEFRVDVSTAGEVVAFEHVMAEKSPGRSLSPDLARKMAEDFLRGTMHRDLADLEFIGVETTKREARADHSFTWKVTSVGLGDGSLRLKVDIYGGDVGAYRELVKIPEQWSRDYQTLRFRNVTTQSVDEVFWVLLSLAMLVILFRRMRDRDVPARMALAFGAVGSLLWFLGQLNNFPLEEFNYRTTDSYSSFLTKTLLSDTLEAMAVGTFIFLLVASAEPVYREAYPRLMALRGTFTKRGFRTRQFLRANLVGVALTFFFFAYQTVFYLVANRLGAWAPAEVNYSDLLNTRLPWVWVLFIGFFPAVSEELQFRAFSIPFLGRFLRSPAASVVFSAFIWGFLHSSYPNQPFFIRGVEVGVGGVIVGLVMLRFGILATLIWHYSVDALYTAFLLLRSHNTYLMVSGGVTAGIMLAPLAAALVAYWRRGTFADEAPVTNSAAGVSRAIQAPVREPETPLVYRALDRRRIFAAGALTLGFVALALVPAYRLGKGIRVRPARQDALRIADDYLARQRVDAGRYHRAAWLFENVDQLALRYLLERRPLPAVDRIYRQGTALLIWRVRYFRPLEKEEYVVNVDAETGRVFSAEHDLDENAPGASLSAEQARALGEKFLARQGVKVSGFDLQESNAEDRKARRDYSLTFQAESGDPRNVGDEHYRLEVEIAGDEVVGFAHRFKLPEDWVRQRSAIRLSSVLLGGVRVLFLGGLLAGALILLVRQIRAGKMPWRRLLPAGVLAGAALLVELLNGLPRIEQIYPTEQPLGAFWIVLCFGLFIVALAAGLVVWIAAALVTSLWPDAAKLLSPVARRLWRRDAAVAMGLSLAAVVGLSKLDAILVERFHAFLPLQIASNPFSLDSISPGLGNLMVGILRTLLFGAAAGILMANVQEALKRRAWWFWFFGVALLIALGPPDAQSLPEFALVWGENLVRLAAVVALVVFFFRANISAYLASAFAVSVALPAVVLLEQPNRFFVLNGLALVAVSILALGWLLNARDL